MHRLYVLYLFSSSDCHLIVVSCSEFSHRRVSTFECILYVSHRIWFLMWPVWPEDEAAFPGLLLYFSSHCLLFGLKNSVAGADREASHNGHDPPSIRASRKHQAGFSRAAQSFIYARERGFRFSGFPLSFSKPFPHKVQLQTQRSQLSASFQGKAVEVACHPA